MAEGTDLKAGALSLRLIDGDLRKIAWNDTEIVNRIYVAVRDPNWGTVPGRLTDLTVESEQDRFLIRYRSEHRDGEIHFVWSARIEGDAAGCLRFQMEGEALASFKKNRIGLCILHPASAAGDRVIVTHADGSTSDGTFPKMISPHQPFKEMRRFRHLLSSGIESVMSFSGDVFEMEDQRNWTDGSFKTYSTPIELPFPVTVEKGTQVKQSVDLVVSGTARADISSGTHHTAELSRVTLATDGSEGQMPEIGFGYGSLSTGLSDHARSRLADLCPSFLDVTLPMHEQGWQTLLDAALTDARNAGLPLLFTLRLSEHAETELDALLARLHRIPVEVKYWTILSDGAPSTTSDHLRIARKRLGDYGGGRPIGGGTRSFFAELNRNRPDFGLLDFVSYTVNPQVHATDEVSMVETLAGQRATVESARAMSNNRPVHIGAITLKTQWNPNATAPPKALGPDELPPQVDPRQRGAFAAAWTLGSIKTLAESGVDAATYFEVEGWKGLMEGPAGSRLPSEFPSQPNELFAVYRLFREISGAAGNAVVATKSTTPLEVGALALRTPNGLRVFLANYTNHDRDVALESVHTIRAVSQLVPEPSASDSQHKPAVEGSSSVVPVEASSIVAVDCER